MFPYIWCGTTFYFAVLVTSIHGIDPKNSSEKIFAGVIQNITRVNKVLEELIQNYENLQKIYDSQELFETTEYNLSQKGNKTALNITINPRADKYIATEMIWSDQKDDSAETSDTDTSAKTKQPVTTKQSKTTQSELLILLSSDEDVKEKPSKEPPKTEVIFINTHKQLKDETKTKQNNTNKKTRFSIQPSIQKNEKASEEKNKQYRSANNTSIKTNEQKKEKDKGIIITSTAKSILMLQGTTIPKESVNSKNKTFISRTHYFGMSNKTNLKKQDRNDKKRNVSRLEPKIKTELRKVVAVQKQNNREVENDVDETFSFTDEDETLSKDEFKTNILRKAYGDACLKLVIRKCYKACENTLKIACRTQCSSGIKKVFKKHYKGQCDMLFADMDYRATDKTSDTVNGYLATYCQAQKRSEPAIVEDGNNTNSLNILRSKYEKACIKTSREKCKDACTYSYTKACEKHQCKEKKTKLFGKTCKRQCNIAFTGRFEKTKKASTSSSEESSSSTEDSSD